MLFVPGFVFLKALYPSRVEVNLFSANIDVVERLTLSIGLSIALTAMIGLILNYTPFGIRLAPIVVSLFGFSVICAVTALIRERKAITEPA